MLLPIILRNIADSLPENFQAELKLNYSWFSLVTNLTITSLCRTLRFLRQSLWEFHHLVLQNTHIVDAHNRSVSSLVFPLESLGRRSHYTARSPFCFLALLPSFTTHLWRSKASFRWYPNLITLFRAKLPSVYIYNFLSLLRVDNHPFLCTYRSFVGFIHQPSGWYFNSFSGLTIFSFGQIQHSIS